MGFSVLRFRTFSFTGFAAGEVYAVDSDEHFGGAFDCGGADEGFGDAGCEGIDEGGRVKGILDALDLAVFVVVENSGVVDSIH